MRQHILGVVGNVMYCFVEIKQPLQQWKKCENRSRFYEIIVTIRWCIFWDTVYSDLRTSSKFRYMVNKPRRFFPYAAGEGPTSFVVRSSVCWHFLFCSIIKSSRAGSFRASCRSSRTRTRGNPKNGSDTTKKRLPMKRKPAHHAPTQRGLLDVSFRSTVSNDSRST